MSLRLAAFVVTYRRPEILVETLKNLLGQTRSPETVLVVDNGSCEETRVLVREMAARGVRYLDSGGNLGPAGGAAKGLERLASEDWDIIYWGDDDDPPRTPDTLARLARLFERGGRRAPAAAGAVGAPFDWTTGRIGRFSDESLKGELDVDVVAGGSQMMVHSDTVRRIGLPRAEFFFGLEDLDYCLRMRRQGLRILVDGDLMRTYRELAGRLNLTIKRSATPRGPASAQWRQYYSTRNLIYTLRTTFDRPDLARRCAFRAAAKSIAAWRRGPKIAAATARYQLLAVVDGYAARLGPRVAPTPK